MCFQSDRYSDNSFEGPNYDFNRESRYAPRPAPRAAPLQSFESPSHQSPQRQTYRSPQRQSYGSPHQSNVNPQIRKKSVGSPSPPQPPNMSGIAENGRRHSRGDF